MPDSKKKVSSKKDTLVKETKSTKKKTSEQSKEVKPKTTKVTQKKDALVKDVKKVEKKTTPKKTTSTNKKESNSSKQSKTSTNIQKKKQESVQTTTSSNTKRIKKDSSTKSTSKNEDVTPKREEKKKTLEKKNISESNHKKNNSKLKDIQKTVKFDFSGMIQKYLKKDKKSSKKVKRPIEKKKNKKKQAKKEFSILEKIKSISSSLSKTTKKRLLIVLIVCAVIILLEGIYFVCHRINTNLHTVYYDSLNSLVVDDTNTVVVGSSQFKYSKYNSYTKGLEKAKLVKYDKEGKIIFEKMYDKGINTTFSSIITIKDGYIVVGSGEFSEEENSDGAREAMIIKFDKEGNLVWEKFYQVVTNTRFNKVIATSDGYIAIGQSIYANMELGNHKTGGGIIVKYDLEGNEVWHNNHGGMKSGNFQDVVEVNGSFYVVGKDATDTGKLIKYNKDGKYEWLKNYNYTDGIGFTGIAYLDNSLYVVGSKKILEDPNDTENRNTTNTDALFIKFDLDGNILFEKVFGGSNYERYNSILAHQDNLYVVGYISSTDAGMKINSDGELTTGILVRYDKNGNILKKESLGGSKNDNLTDIITDGVSLYISGYSNSKDGNITTAKNNGKDYFGKVIKLDFKFRTLMVK